MSYRVVAFFLFATLSFSLTLSGLAKSNAPVTEEVRSALVNAVLFLEKTQQKETQGDDHFEGEWPSYIENRATIPFVGKKGKLAYDSNSFTVSSVHNALAAAYLRQPDLISIPPLLDRAIGRVLSYRTGDSFNFWPLLEAPGSLKLKEPVLLRRPNHYSLETTLSAGFCNVASDSDDTAAALLAMKNYQRIRPESSLPREIGPIFSTYRDEDRTVSHPYNMVLRMTHTGAFLTWLAPEHPLRPSGILPSLNHPNIPIGINDVDCVVNANILATLADFNELKTNGTQEACRLVNWAFSHGKQQSCGVYYPSPYNLHYATAKAFAAGAECLQASVEPLVKELLRDQNFDGSWNSQLSGDQVHSSLYALNALLYLAEHVDETVRESTRSAIDRGINYIVSQQKTHPEGGVFWPAGVFFSAGTKAREKLIWKSEPYTTALAVDALSLWLNQRH